MQLHYCKLHSIFCFYCRSSTATWMIWCRSESADRKDKNPGRIKQRNVFKMPASFQSTQLRNIPTHLHTLHRRTFLSKSQGSSYWVHVHIVVLCILFPCSFSFASLFRLFFHIMSDRRFHFYLSITQLFIAIAISSPFIKKRKTKPKDFLVRHCFAT